MHLFSEKGNSLLAVQRALLPQKERKCTVQAFLRLEWRINEGREVRSTYNRSLNTGLIEKVIQRAYDWGVSMA